MSKITNQEIGKLIQYGYDLHEKEMNYHTRYLVPSFELYDGDCYPIKQIENGGVFGFQGFPNHSFSYVCTTLGVCVGKKVEKGFALEYAVLLRTDNREFETKILPLELSKDSKQYYPTLSYDFEARQNLTGEEKIELFIKALQFIGFKRDDVLNVIKGNMSAREAYVNIAPDDKKNIQWVSKYRRFFVFDGNVAIEGNFNWVDLDEFPFPFNEQPILDCSKVKTSGVRFQNNLHRVKLINVNKKRNSIQYTDLKNAIIEEPIDLSLVDATDTKFGHHIVINLEKSIAKLMDMDLSLAINEKGESYLINKDGSIQTFSIETSKGKNEIQVLSNADNLTMSKLAFENDADGVGLVRTEHIFQDAEDVIKMVNLMTADISSEAFLELVDRIKFLQSKQAREVLENAGDKKVIFRLMDFKVKENIKQFALDCNLKEINIDTTRGTYKLMRYYERAFEAQLEAIFEECIKADKKVNLLIPMVTSTNEFVRIKEKVITISKKYNIEKLKIGAMVENIEIANDADLLAKKADFLSIGTNDLTESITGLSRETNSIEFQQLNDDVKDTIKEIIYRARVSKPNIIIGICGEHSNYIENVQFYSNLGINYITCHPTFVKSNKEFLNINKNKKREIGNGNRK